MALFENIMIYSKEEQKNNQNKLIEVSKYTQINIILDICQKSR